MTNNTYGYVRVSTHEQNEARQLIAMRDFGVAEENIIIEKQSGKDFQRELYLGLVQRLRPGDVLVVKSIDRLGRNYTEILEQWGAITKGREAAIVVLDMPLLDTRQGRDLMGTLIADIVLQLLSYVAQTERETLRRRQAEGIAAAKDRGVRFGPERMALRENLRQRQAEGIAAARERGVRFGRERLPLPPEFQPLAELWREGSISSRAAASELGISYQTFLRRVKEAAL